jgi:ectoine hydroxylase-related dioxygenase (phytanoyl-CoA dioxygenase family)
MWCVMNNLWAFLPMRTSNDLLDDPAALRERLEADSYLFLKRILDPAKVLRLRSQICESLAGLGWIEGGPFAMQAVTKVRPLHEDQEAFFEGYDAVQRLEDFHTLAHDDDLTALMRSVVGETAFPHPLKVARLAFPAHYEVATPPHQDYPNNQGTPNLTAAWIPVGDCPRDLGSLAVLRGSSRYGLLPLDAHPAAGNRQAVLPEEMLRDLRWVTTDFEAGDVLVFSSHTVHAALHNATEFNLRISVDFRYQREREPLTELVLHPHFGRISWDEIYAGWKSEAFQYYWHDLEFDVVPFAEFDLVGGRAAAGDWDAAASTLGEAIVEGVESGALEFSPDQWREIMTLEAKREARHARHLDALARLDIAVDSDDEPSS